MKQDWIETKELIGVLDLPKTTQGVTKKAKAAGWKRRRKVGARGNVYEYYIGDMPEYLQKNFNFDKSKIEKSKNNQDNKTTKLKDLKMVPFYKTFASAGFGSINKEIYDPDDWIGFSPKWLNNMGIYSSKLALIMTTGDSMQPTIHNNDIILINMQEITPKDGNIYVVRQGDQLWVKRVQGIVGGIRLISDNKEIYQPIDINFHENLDFEVIGQVVCVLHSFI